VTKNIERPNTILRCYQAQVGNWLGTSWDNLSVPYSRAKQSKESILLWLLDWDT